MCTEAAWVRQLLCLLDGETNLNKVLQVSRPPHWWRPLPLGWRPLSGLFILWLGQTLSCTADGDPGVTPGIQGGVAKGKRREPPDCHENAPSNSEKRCRIDGLSLEMNLQILIESDLLGSLFDRWEMVSISVTMKE